MIAVASAIELDGNKIKQARIVIGGVAHKPWRVFDAEKSLVGKTANKASFEAAATIALAGAKPLAHNSYKIELAKRAIVVALERALAS